MIVTKDEFHNYRTANELSCKFVKNNWIYQDTLQELVDKIAINNVVSRKIALLTLLSYIPLYVQKELKVHEESDSNGPSNNV